MKLLMSVRSHQRLLLFSVISGLIFIILLKKSDDYVYGQNSNEVKDRKSYQCAIATLIRSTNRSINLVINMIHSVSYFYTVGSMELVPKIIVFHDENLTETMRNMILSCVKNVNIHLNISFAYVGFNDSQSLVDPKSLVRYSIGYRIMSRFWAHDVFYHPIIKKLKIDYLMRMDDDSYFNSPIKDDLFTFMLNERLDYIYRSRYRESSAPMLPVKMMFLGKNVTDDHNCIYNNFFAIRLQWFYKSKRIQSFMKELLRDNRMIRQYIGDGCVHAAWLSIDNKIKTQQIEHIGYGHNYHISNVNVTRHRFMNVPDFSDEINNSCKQLTVIQGFPAQLKKINL